MNLALILDDPGIFTRPCISVHPLGRLCSVILKQSLHKHN